MKLVSLTCNQASFKPIRFAKEGLTLVVGGAADESDEGSSNGVGKTLSLGLVHHCLGASVNPRLADSVPDWVFRLEFLIGASSHVIERTGDGREILLDGAKLSIGKLRRWLDANGPFALPDAVGDLTFRSLFSRFARHHRGDCTSPIATRREQDYASRLRSLHLLGIDPLMVAEKRNVKKALDRNRSAAKTWRDEQRLREMFRAGTQPKVRVEWLDREIPRLEADLDQFRVAEDYRAIELEAGTLTESLRDTEKQQAVIRFRLSGIEKALAEEPDISRQDLLDLYDGLQALFRPETLAHFEAVEAFHGGLAANRRQKLTEDKNRLNAELARLETLRESTAQRRDERLQTLSGTRALDEFASLSKNLAGLQEERNRLQEFLSFSDRMDEEAQTLRERKIEEDGKAAAYVRDDPLLAIDGKFREIAELLYPRNPAGIVLQNNVGDNQVRFDLTVQIQGDDSDGINSARILCFDWVMLLHGANHSMGFLWHDNRLFADIDPRQRARWFVHTLEALPATGKQYIATLNTENFDTMRSHMSEDMWSELTAAVNVRLGGDDAAGKLLGIQFGS